MKTIFPLLLLFISNAVLAISYDKRINYEVYSPDRVFTIKTAVGKATTIQFEKDENLVSDPSSLLALGDINAWTLGVKGYNVTFKPSERRPNTNLTIVTNKRTYLFDLVNVSRGKEQYVVRFTYPKTKAEEKAEHEAMVRKIREGYMKRSALRAARKNVNTAFFWKGESEELKPTAAYDDGRFTHLIYDHAGSLPVFFKVLPDGTETLINYHVDQENKAIIVLHDLAPVIKARLNNLVIEIVNKGYKVPEINKYGSTEAGVIRLNKGEIQ